MAGLSRFARVLPLLLLGYAGLSGGWCAAQTASDDSDAIRGVVINSVTHDPIERALVFSPDNRFATLTSREGRFEFRLPKKVDPDSESARESTSPDRDASRTGSSLPSVLMARKPGFLADPNQQGMILEDGAPRELTLGLTPEAVIAGTVTLPTSEAPDSITLQLFQRQVQEGRAHWVAVGASQSMSDGSFRFADLTAGTYKLLSTELLDTDPVLSDPHVDPFAADARGPLFGYPPVYYPNAPDFASATAISLGAGETETADLSLVKQPYYRVKLPVVVPESDESEPGFQVTVYAGHKGPGFTLGYNPLHHAVEGMLPNGTYTVEVTSVRSGRESGSKTVAIKKAAGDGSRIEGPSIGLTPKSAIAVNVKEEFTAADHTGSLTLTHNDRTTVLNGPRRYLNVSLEPVDEFGTGQSIMLRPPVGRSDESMVLEGASPGKYWVHVYSSRGYPASIRSGEVDLQHQPLVVGAGGAAAPIEITMRDDMAEISGTVDGVAPPGQGTGSIGPMPNRVRVYCIPLADSSGQYAEIEVHGDGSFESQRLPPGAYRVIAFDGAQREIEYRNPEAMQDYGSKGAVVRLAGGQKEHVTLQLNSLSTPSNEPSSEPTNEPSNEPSTEQ